MNALTRVDARAAAPAAEAGQYLTFVLGGELYAIPILATKEIIEFGQLTPVPMMPSFVRGVINLRGAVVPVIDLANRFGGAPSGLTRRSCIVIVELEREGEMQVVGVMVDAVNEVVEIGQIEPPPAFGSGIPAGFLHGMGKLDGRFVLILDVDRVLSADELSALDAVEAQADPAGRKAA